MKLGKKTKIILIVVPLVLVVLGSATLAGLEVYTSQSSFCGSCHIMKPYYESWKAGKHAEHGVDCVDCHYAPGEKGSLKAKFKGLGQLFSYLGTDITTVRAPAKVNDLSCGTADCHPNQTLSDKKLKFTEEISYVHNTHMDKTVEGQTLHCATCHQHVTREKHFEVPQSSCFLCHFHNAELNEGRAKCSLCHTIPDTPILKTDQPPAPDQEVITHKALEEAGVSCTSCHHQIVRRTGNIKVEDCFHCHEDNELLREMASDKTMMHKAHVGEQNAKCFDCHSPMEHGDQKHGFMDGVVANCTVCHPDHHKHQKLLIKGEGGKGLEKSYPIKHFNAQLNCLACHTRETHDRKGVKVLKADFAKCTACHKEGTEKLPQKWKADILESLEEVREYEQKALKILAAKRPKLSKEKLSKFETLVAEAQANVKLVFAGGGVHNKKYAVLLLDVALEKFEEVIDELE